MSMINADVLRIVDNKVMFAGNRLKERQWGYSQDSNEIVVRHGGQYYFIGASNFNDSELRELINSVSSSLNNKANINHTHAQSEIDGLVAALNNKQDKLQAGDNITINGNTISAIGGAEVYDDEHLKGMITTETTARNAAIESLLTSINSKQNILTAGDNISITNNVISATDTKYNDTEVRGLINGKANAADLTAHVNNDNIHVTTNDKTNWNSKANGADLAAHVDDSTIHVTLADKTAWNAKQNQLTAGSNITITNNTISATSGGGGAYDDSAIVTALGNKEEIWQRVSSSYAATEWRYLGSMNVKNNQESNNFNGMLNIYSRSNNTYTSLLATVYIAIPAVFNTFPIEAGYVGMVAEGFSLWYFQNGSGTNITSFDLWLRRDAGGTAYAATVEVLKGSMFNDDGKFYTKDPRPSNPTPQTAVKINSLMGGSGGSVDLSGIEAQINGKENAITAGTTAQYWKGNKTWADFGTDVRGSVLTGLSTSTTTAVSATDSLLVGIGKLQGQISAKEAAISAGTNTQYYRGDKTWQDFSPAVRSSTLTGLSTATSTAVAAADTVLVGMGKLQAQISGKYTLPSGGTTSQYLDGTGTLKTFPTIPTSATGTNQQADLGSTTAANSISASTIGITGTLPPANGGTGNTSFTGSALVYFSSGNQRFQSVSAVGATNQILQGTGGAPTWLNAPTTSGDVLTYDGSAIKWAAPTGGGSTATGTNQYVTLGTSNNTGSNSLTSATLPVYGTLGVNNGGTGLNLGTSTGVLYRTSTSGAFTMGTLPIGQIGNIAASKLVGRYSTSAGAGQEITIGSGLSLSSGGELTATATGGTTSNVTTSAAGLVPSSSTGTGVKAFIQSGSNNPAWTGTRGTSTTYLKGDGTWGTPEGNVYNNVTASAAGLVSSPASTANRVFAMGTSTSTAPSWQQITPAMIAAAGSGTTGQVLTSNGSSAPSWKAPAAVANLAPTVSILGAISDVSNLWANRYALATYADSKTYLSFKNTTSATTGNDGTRLRMGGFSNATMGGWIQSFRADETSPIAGEIYINPAGGTTYFGSNIDVKGEIKTTSDIKGNGLIINGGEVQILGSLINLQFGQDQLFFTHKSTGNVVQILPDPASGYITFRKKISGTWSNMTWNATNNRFQ